MKEAIKLRLHQLRQPVARRDIWMAVAVLFAMTVVLAVLEFTRRSAWIEPALLVVLAFAIVQGSISLVLLQRRIERSKKQYRDRPPPPEPAGAGVPIGPRKPAPLAAHAVPPTDPGDDSAR